LLLFFLNLGYRPFFFAKRKLERIGELGILETWHPYVSLEKKVSKEERVRKILGNTFRVQCTKLGPL
jgi:hypothetical protein